MRRTLTIFLLCRFVGLGSNPLEIHPLIDGMEGGMKLKVMEG